MNRSRISRHFVVFTLLFVMVGCLVGSQAVLAAQEATGGLFLSPVNQEEEPQPEEAKVNIETKFPVVSGESGDSFEFEVEVEYTGGDRREFDLTTSVPSRWVAVPVSSYPEKQIAAVVLDQTAAPSYGAEKIKVRFAPILGHLPEPGDYVVTLEVSSGELKGTIDLTARVTAKYGLDLYTQTGRLNTDATAGKDNHVSILLINLGSAPIENITFSSTKPEGWSITYTPTKVDSLEPGLTQEVDVVVNPPRKTIAGDWPVTIKAESKQIRDELELRVTVLTPTIWGWVGIIIVLVVIAGVGVLFWRLGRR